MDAVKEERDAYAETVKQLDNRHGTSTIANLMLKMKQLVSKMELDRNELQSQLKRSEELIKIQSEIIQNLLQRLASDNSNSCIVGQIEKLVS